MMSYLIQPLGGSTFWADDVSPATLCALVKEVCHHSLVLDVPGIYKKVSDLIDAPAKGFCHGQPIARNVISFEKGLGVNTMTAIKRYGQSSSRQQVSGDAFPKPVCFKYLMLLKPSQQCQSQFAVGVCSWHSVLRKPAVDNLPYITLCTNLNIRYASESEVVQIFQDHPGVALNFVTNLWSVVQSEADRLNQRALDLHAHAQYLKRLGRQFKLRKNKSH